MNDETTDNDKAGRHSRGDRDMGIPTVHDAGLVEFLEGLFYSHPDPPQLPERIDLNVVSTGPRADVRDTIWTKQFAPMKANAETIKKGAGAPKPNKEEIVALSNYLIGRMKHHCNEFGQTRVYSVDAFNTSRGPDAYQRYPKKMTPNGRRGRSDDADGGGYDEESGEPLTRDQRFLLQMYRQQKEMHEWVGELVSGFIDRLNRDKERDSDEIHKLHKELSGKNEQLERALSLELDREERRESLRVRRHMLEKGFQVVEQYGPVLMASLLGNKGQKVINGTAVDIAEVLRKFLSSATPEQLEKAFGDWDQTKCLKEGVLNAEQALIFVHIANGNIPTGEIEKLIPPNGSHKLTNEQLFALAGIFSPEQLQPLKDLFLNNFNKQGAQ